MANNIQSTLTYNANLSAAMAEIKSLTGQIGVLSTSMNSLDAAALKMRASLAAAFSANVGALGGFTTKMAQLNTVVDTFGKNLAANKLTMREYFAEAYRGLTRQDSLMRQFARNQARYMESIVVPMGSGGGKQTGMVITPNEIDLRNTTTRMNVLNQEFNTFRHLVNNGANEMINFGKNTQWTGRQLTVGLTMPVVLFGAAFAKTFMDVDKELTRFAKVYGQDVVGTTARATEDMKQQVIDLAKTISSNYGVAAKETLALAADVAATGKEGQDLLDTVSQTSRLAVLGEVDRQEAMKATLAIQTAFKQNTDELAESINFLNAIENQTSTTLNDLVEAIPKAGPVIKGLGGSIKDLSVLMVAMKEGGIPAAEAANAIKSGMASLINPTKKAADTAKEFGVNIVDIVTANKGQLMPTLLELQGALNGLDDFSRSRVIEEIFGKYQFARISALFNNLGVAGSQTQQAMELAGASTVELASIANQELRAYTESTTVRFQRMMETVKNQLLPIGESLLQILTPALEKVSGIIDFLRNLFGSLPEPIKNFLGIMGGFALVAGPILMLVGLFKQLVGNTIKFGMGIVTLGAQLAGIKTSKLEVLDEQTMAAKAGVDKLTTAFATQEAAVMNLRGELELYLSALKKTAAMNPQMFAGAPVAGARRAPIRRAQGGDVPGGYGGGDIIPALLEPGEMVIRKEAVAKYAPILGAMNRGNLRGFSNGSGPLDPLQSAHTTVAFAPGTRQYQYGLDSLSGVFRTIARQFPEAIKVLSKSVALLPTTLNMALKESGADIETFRRKYSDVGPGKYLPSAIQGGFDVSMPGAASALRLFDRAVRDRAIQIAEGTREGKITDEILARAQRQVVNEYYQTKTGEDNVQKAQRALASAVAQQASRVAVVRVGLTDQMIYNQRGDLKEGFQIMPDGSVQYRGTTVRRPGSKPVTPVEFSGQRAAGPEGNPFRTSTGQVTQPVAFGLGGGRYLRSGAAIELLEREERRLGEEQGRARVVAYLHGLRTGLESSSPSRRARRETTVEGRNFADGAILGLSDGIENLPERAAAVVNSEARQAAGLILPGRNNMSGPLILPGQGTIPSGPLILPGAGQRPSGPLLLPGAGQRPSGPLLLPGAGQMPTGPLIIPQSSTGPNESIRAAMTDQIDIEDAGSRQGGRRGIFGTGMVSMGLFGITGVTSTLGMFNESLGQATSGLNNFLFGLTSIIGVMEMVAMFRGGGFGGGGSGAAAAAGGAGRFGAFARFLPIVANPYLAAAAVAVGALAVAYFQFKKQAEEARKAAIAAFAEPTETAKFFGKEVKNTQQILKDAAAESIFATSTIKGSMSVDPALTEKIKTDYEDLIESLKDFGSAGAARELAVAFNTMLMEGLRAGEAKAAIVAIAKEAGQESALAYVSEFTKATTVGEAIRAQTALISKVGLRTGRAQAEATREQARVDLFNQFGINPDDLTRVAPEQLTFQQGATGQAMAISTYGKQVADLYQRIVAAQTMPANQVYPGTGKTALQSLGFPSIEEAKNELARLINEVNGYMNEFKNSHTEVMTLIDKEGKFFVEATVSYIESFMGAYKDAPQAAIDGFKTLGNDIAEVTGNDLDPLKQKLGELAPQYQPLLDKVNDGATLMKIFAAAAQGIPVDKFYDASRGAEALNVALLDSAISAQLLADVVASKLALAMNQITQGMITKFQETAAFHQTEIQNIQDQLEIDLKAIEVASKARERAHEDAMQQSDDKIDTLEKESKSIEKTANAYIQSLQKRKRAEDFYSRQAQTGMGAIRSLASGDVFGYLEARARMAADAEQQALDRTIEGIQERAKAEQDVIQLKIDKEQEYQEELGRSYKQFQRNQEDARETATQTAKDMITAHQNSLKAINTAIKTATTDVGGALKVFAETYGDKAAEPYQKAYTQAQSLAYLQQLMSGATPRQAFLDVFGINLPQNMTQPRHPDTGEFLPSFSPSTGSATPGGTSKIVIQVPGQKPITIDFQQGRAQGGYISGPGTPTSDSIPAMLSNGEYVVRASSVKKYGVGMMDSINAGAFAAGGLARKHNMPRYNMGGQAMSYAMGGLVGPGNVYNIQVNAGNIDDPNMLADIIIRKIENEASRRSHSRRM